MLSVLDLDFHEGPRSLAGGLFNGPGGAILVDPGPSSALEGLRRGLAEHGRSVDDLQAILLTHIHLDHAGATGVLARENPRLRIFVHARGAPHVVDPSKLVASASRLYGDRMEALWGEIAPVEARRIQALQGGERLELAGRILDVAYTPGHAWHHVSYLDRVTGTACVGDVAGVRFAPSEEVIPPTPPPDIDVERWNESLEAIAAWTPSRLLLTHFGTFDDVGPHLDRVRARLNEMASLARQSLDAPAGDDGERIAWFRARMRESLAARLGAEAAAAYEAAQPLEHYWQGLARYWRRRDT
jgi:glyoxylase-like metal-dependent hydrolase (beta-lactamase superfamily II)